MCSITGFGQSGPKAGLAYTDIVVYAMSGLQYIAGDPSLPPCKAPETQAYYFGSLFGALGVVAALYRRENTGGVITSIFQCRRPSPPRKASSECTPTTGRFCAGMEAAIPTSHPPRFFHARMVMFFSMSAGEIGRIFWKFGLIILRNLRDADWMDNGFRRTHAECFTDNVAEFTSRFKKNELTKLLQSRGINCLPVNRPQRISCRRTYCEARALR